MRKAHQVGRALGQLVGLVCGLVIFVVHTAVCRAPELKYGRTHINSRVVYALVFRWHCSLASGRSGFLVMLLHPPRIVGCWAFVP